MRIELKPGTVLVEPTAPAGSILWQPNGHTASVGMVKQTAYEDVVVGDEVFYYPSAGLGITSNGRRFLLLGAADLLAKVA